MLFTLSFSSASSHLIIIQANSIAVFLNSGTLLFFAIGNKEPNIFRIKNCLYG